LDMNTPTRFTEAAFGNNDSAVRGYEKSVTAFKDGMAKSAASFEAGQTKMKEGMDKIMKTAEEMIQFNQGNFDAVVKSSQIWVSGVQDLGKQVAASAQASFEQTVSTFKALSSVKSLKDAIDLQTSLARSSVEKAVAETSRLTDASVKLAEAALAPLTARMTLAVEKFAKSA
jgi:phasin family protein